MTLHSLQQDDEREEVVLIVMEWLVHRLTYSLARCKVNNPLDPGVRLEDVLNDRFVIAICFVEDRANTRNCLDPIEDFDVGVGEVIDADDLVACLDKLYRGMGADVAGTTCYENDSFHDLL